MEQQEDNLVITTRQVFHQGFPILHIRHEFDGDWQVLGEQDITEEDALVVSVAKIYKLDLTTKTALEIPRGYEAYRKSATDKWIISKIVVEENNMR
jgi:hypothetical protein